MSKILIVFESAYGQTKKIAEHVEGFVKLRGHGVRVAQVRAGEITDADAVIILAHL